MDIIPRDHDDVNFNEEAKSIYIYIYEKINQADNHEKEWVDNLPQNAEDFYENESNSPSSGYCQNDELTENHCGNLVFDSSSVRERALSYMEKVHAFL